LVIRETKKAGAMKPLPDGLHKYKLLIFLPPAQPGDGFFCPDHWAQNCAESEHGTVLPSSIFPGGSG